MQLFHKFQRITDAHGTEIHNTDPAHSHSSGNIGKPLTMAVGTGSGCHTLLQLLACRIRLGFPEAASDIGKDALKGLLQNAHTAAPVVGHPQFFASGAVQDHIHGGIRELLNWNVQREMIFLCQGFEIHTENGIRSCAAPARSLDRAIQNALFTVRDHKRRIGDKLKAQTGTVGAGPRRIIE